MRAALIVAGAAAATVAAYLLTRGGGEGDQAPGAIDYVRQLESYGSSIFMSEDDMTAQANIAAFLRAIRPGEGTADRQGYQRYFGGGNFTSFADHPANLGWPGVRLPDAMCANAGFGPGCVSTAAGAYQINRPTWNRLKDKLGLSDFSPASQDAAAIELITEKGALEDVKTGDIASAVDKVSGVWASLPGAGYGQNEVAMSAFADQFTSAGGTTA